MKRWSIGSFDVTDGAAIAVDLGGGLTVDGQFWCDVDQVWPIR
ncbi:MAG: hypothetical protein ACREIM_07250 [Nitrospiraceae bacterium]